MGMKKIISFLLITALVCTCIPGVFAADAVAAQVEVDLSEYDGTVASITNDGTSNATVFSLSGTTPPSKGVATNADGKQTTYLQFGTGKGSLLITDTNTQNLGAGTVVFWMKKDTASNNNNWFFNYGDGTTKMFGVKNSGTNEQLNALGTDQGNAVDSQWVGKWRMMAITRSYDEVNKTWIIRLFPADRNANEWSYRAWKVSQDPKQNETGFRYEFGQEQDLKIANIKIYDYELTPAELTTLRTNEATAFENVTDTQLSFVVPQVDVDLSDYDGTAASILNKGKNESAVFSLSGTTPPSKGVATNADGEQTTYLQFGSGKGSLLITDTNTQNLGAGTVVFWMKKDSSIQNGQSYFNYGDGTTKMFGVMNQWGQEQLIISNAGGSYINSEWVGQWRMMALTRSYDETSKKWTIKLYPADRDADDWGSK